MVMAMAALTSPPAHADTQAEPTPDELTFTSSITVETFEPDNKTLTSTSTYGEETQGQLMGVDGAAAATAGPATNRGNHSVSPMASGSGGTSSASGCIKVTVNNVAKTVLGFTAYIFHTWTDWCWTRSTQVVYNVTHGWYISDVDPEEYWKGIVNSEFLFYDYSTNDGHPKSAYKNYMQGQFDNCILKYGCVGTTYPTNTLRSYYNGTWAWSTSGT
jgi:hypothetical protein